MARNGNVSCPPHAFLTLILLLLSLPFKRGRRATGKENLREISVKEL